MSTEARVSSVEQHPLAPLRSLRVDDQGLLLETEPSDAGHDAALDVLFDDRRIWSFWTVRDDDVLYVSNAPGADLQKFLTTISNVAFSVIGITNALDSGK